MSAGRIDVDVDRVVAGLRQRDKLRANALGQVLLDRAENEDASRGEQLPGQELRIFRLLGLFLFFFLVHSSGSRKVSHSHGVSPFLQGVNALRGATRATRKRNLRTSVVRMKGPARLTSSRAWRFSKPPRNSAPRPFVATRLSLPPDKRKKTPGAVQHFLAICQAID